MKKNAFIIHGAEGHPEENWFPWLKRELEKRNYQVFVPKFPTPEKQTLDEWLKVMTTHKDHLNEDCILVGHSLGVPFILNILEKNKAKSAFLVAGFVGEVNNAYNESIKTFAHRNFDWKGIKKNCNRFYMFHSEDDPYLELDKAERIAKELKCHICLYKNAGHFNESAGYKEFPELLSYIFASEK